LLPPEGGDASTLSSDTAAPLSPGLGLQLVGVAKIDGAANSGHELDRLIRRELGLAQQAVHVVERDHDPELGGIARDAQMGVHAGDRRTLGAFLSASAIGLEQ
jgi:hypothetical protein